MPYCPSCGGPVGESDAICEHCGATLRRGVGDEAAGAGAPPAGEARANGHADHRDSTDAGGQGPQYQEPPDAGRRMLLKAFGGFGVLAAGAVVLFGGNGGGGTPEPSGDTGGEVAPTAAFSFDYDGRADTVTVTHDGGDPIRVDELYVRTGESLGESGTWDTFGGSASGAVEGVDAVVAGDSVEVSVQPDYVVRVVWQSSATNKSSELASDRGPQA